MKSNLFCIILACVAITLAAQEEIQDILEFFLPQDLLFRNECVNNYNNADCAAIRYAISTQHKYGCALKYLEKNEEYLAKQYFGIMNPDAKKPFKPRANGAFSSRNPKIKNSHDALVVKYISEKLLADKNVNNKLDATARRLIIQSTANQPDIDKDKQLELMQIALNCAHRNQRLEEI